MNAVIPGRARSCADEPGIQSSARSWIPGPRQRVRAKRGPMTGSARVPEWREFTDLLAFING
jgi:hypothetical protein